jgi:acyl phosphate:glycerol-3-phosphate acyltransferase
MVYIMVLLGGYLFGSFPTGYLAGRAKGLDIRSLGSGNIGATNVFRSLGKGWGVAVLLGDALKGFLACWIAAPFIYRWWINGQGLPPEPAIILAGVGAMLGHMFPVWLGFHGGKGIATAAGVFLALAPLAISISIALWILVVALTRLVSLASIMAAASLPILIWLCGGSYLLIILTFGLSCLSIYRHRSNIKRLLNGTEHRFGAKADKTGNGLNPKRDLT